MAATAPSAAAVTIWRMEPERMSPAAKMPAISVSILPLVMTWPRGSRGRIPLRYWVLGIIPTDIKTPDTFSAAVYFEKFLEVEK